MHVGVNKTTEIRANTVRPYQTEGIEFLINRSSALLADDMGLGKTVQVILAIKALVEHHSIRRALIVVPASLRLNWLEEFGRWAPNLVVRRIEGTHTQRTAYYDLPVSALIGSYEQLRVDAMAMSSRQTYDLVVLDEAQRIKNSSSTLAAACRLIPRRRSWAMTGTPMENRPEDLVSICGFVDPGLLHRGMTRDEIHMLIQPCFLRRRRSEVLPDLPDLIVQDVHLELTPSQRQGYDAVWADRGDLIASSSPGNESANLLSIITRLKMICNHDDETDESCKFRYLRLVLDSMYDEDDKVIVFSQYVSTLEKIQDLIDTHPVIMYHGGLNETQRDRAVKDFQSRRGPLVMLVSLRAGGVGLNLQQASKVVLFDRWWNPAVEDQAVARAHRFGRTGPLHVFRFLVVDTVEERIDDILDEKRELFDAYVEAAPLATASKSLMYRVLDLPHPTQNQGPNDGPTAIRKD